MNGGGKRLVYPFKRQELWKCIGCIISAVTYGKQGQKLWSEIQKAYCRMVPLKILRDVRGDTDVYKVCCANYRHFYIYDCHWIILSYATSFISWMFLWVLTSVYPLQVCGIFLTRFKNFRTFWPSYFVDPSVKGTNNFWKIREMVDRFSESRRKIDSGVEKRQMSRWVPYNFLPPLKDIYCTNPLFLGSRIHWVSR